MNIKQIYSVVFIALLLTSCDSAIRGADSIVTMGYQFFKFLTILIGIVLFLVLLVNLFSKK